MNLKRNRINLARKQFRYLLLLVTGSIFIVAHGAAQPSQVLTAKEIIKLIPEKIMNGFTQSSEPKSKVLQIGTLRYSLSERNFSAGKKNIKILLFDYIEAPIMYSQATKKFTNITEVESDSLVFRTLLIETGNGHEVDNIRNHSSQILIGISERFYLTIEGINVPLEELKSVLEMVHVEKFPR